MAIEFSKSIKLSIIEGLIEHPTFLVELEPSNLLSVLDDTLNLRAQPSEDDRFDNAYDDAHQHLVNNDDWDLNYTFFNRFDIVGEGDFPQMLISLTQPGFQASEKERVEFIEWLNSFTRYEDYVLQAQDFDENQLPLFDFQKYQPDNFYPTGIIKNKIPFIANYNENDVEKYLPEMKEVFILDFKGFAWWNDYSLKSTCSLIYRDADGELNNYGQLKVITSNADQYQFIGNDSKNFQTIVPDSFKELDSSYCSLGQDRSYYFRLKEDFPANHKSILFALKDAALFPDITDIFENDRYFGDSLIRKNKAERLLREVRHELSGVNRADLYQFSYLFSPKFGADEIPPIPVKFDFNGSTSIPNRIWALIGKNGVGKTQLISGLSKHLVEEEEYFFEHNIPLFSRVIVISYSPFDSFKPVRSGKNIDYKFCSLRDERGNMTDDKSRAISFGKARSRLEELERTSDLRIVLGEFLPKEFLDEIFYRDESNELKINGSKLNKIRRELSSGQRVLLEAVTQIIAYIRYDSLLLFDEPETHLHPNAIAELMNTIYSLAEQFQSFCIIATHSPIIVRELFSRNVYVMDRESETLAIRKIGLESFGANLSEITEEIFGVNEISKQYQYLIRKLKSNGFTETEIIDAIKSDDIPLSYSLRLFIKSIFVNIK